MLKLVNITKDYITGNDTVHALKGVSLAFRRSEFVSVLGPSGCGKTTMLNIIGGLDRYNSGDLVIDGKSTKEYNDRDWDIYRNHRIGFIFQSYNLIPHQTVLSNVELALTIAGMSKAERTAKAKQALDKVGLSDKYYKRPNQLSGGQSQRVAIARALVNDPEILLADEPTGALDTKTSEQIMDLVKEIARERLVIMVTHNPELAEKYSTRIIGLLDGELLSDSNPFTEQQEAEERNVSAVAAVASPSEETSAGESGGAKLKRKEKAKMSFWTAFKLSLQNLFSKKGRTIMTSIAGSIGIIGISLVLSISYGVNKYIDNMQNDMLSGNPITIERSAFDVNALLSGMNGPEREAFIKENGWVNVDSMMKSLVGRAETMNNIMVQNTITQEYVDYVMQTPSEYVSAIFLDYGLDISNNIYTDFKEKEDSPAKNMSVSAIKSVYSSILGETDYAKYSDYIAALNDAFTQAPDAPDYILQQYNLLNGNNLTSRVAKEANEVMIVVGKERQLADLLLAQLGYYTQDEFLNLIYEATGDTENFDEEMYEAKRRLAYDELIGKTFTWYPNDTVFERTEGGLVVEEEEVNPFSYKAYSDSTFTDGMTLTVVGILEPKADLSYGCLSNGFYYTSALAEHMIEANKDSVLAQYFAENKKDSVRSGFVMGMSTGITYDYTYTYLDNAPKTVKGYVGKLDQMSSLLNSITGSSRVTYYTLSAQQLGAIELPSSISIYPVDFEQKEHVLDRLDKWNSDKDIVLNGVTLTAEEREKITYTDMLSLIIAMIKTFIQVITIALVGFTALSLVVSTVMIAIITYVSVVERVKEIGVIRSLGGRKRDVSNLFTAETFIIGLASGLIGVLFTYIATGIINLIVNAFAGLTIAVFPWFYALLMIGLSVILTLFSGMSPSRAAAKKDPVVALRTE